MKSAIKSIALKIAPGLVHSVSSYRFFSYCKERFGAFQNRFAQSLFQGNEIRVLAGPFQGMKYFNRIVWGPITPKWLGCYEEELHPVISELLETTYGTIVDVGAAEGYYAVGLAGKFPAATVYAFDIDPIARRRQAELARLNGVSNLVIGKECSHRILEGTLESPSLVICDIEGFEYDLLDPSAVPALKHSDLLVEIHHFASHTAAETRDELHARFSATHRISVVSSSERDPSVYRALIPQLESIPDEEISEAMNEHRPAPQQWLWMKSNHRA